MCTAKDSPVGITTDTGDMHLVAAAKNGDQQAYAELCRRHSDQIFRTVLRITRNIPDAEDSLQEALLRAYLHIGRFEGRSAFSTWLTQIAINYALMLARKKRSQRVYSFETSPDADDFELPEPRETSHNPEESCIQNALENELAQAIRYLPANLRIVMQIRYQEDASGAEIAKMLGITKSAVKTRLFRAKSQIRRHLDKRQCLRSGIDLRTLANSNALAWGQRNPPSHQKRKPIRFKDNNTMSTPRTTVSSTA
jgi:RNA polymerase sigma-70 factor (ECF subfamily)